MRIEQLRLNAALEDEHWWFVGRRRIVRRLVHRLLRAKPGAVIVDVGCGTGGNLAAFAGDHRCVGIDTSADAIELARARFPNVRFVYGEAPRDLGPVAREADLVLLTDVIEHVREDREFLAAIAASTKPGALVLVTVPADPGLWTKHDESHLHHRRYDRDGLASLWSELPVSCLLLSYYNARLAPVIRAIRARNRRRATTSGEADTDLFLPARPLNRLLAAVFSGEGRRLEAALDAGRGGYDSGVSLIAILRRR